MLSRIDTLWTLPESRSYVSFYDVTYVPISVMVSVTVVPL